MKIQAIILIAGIVLYLIYREYFANYVRVRKTFKTLLKFLNARDSLVLKLIPGVNDQEMTNEIIKKIEERKSNFSSGQNNAILSDIKLNSELKKLYEKVNQLKKNEIEKELFSSILSAEQNLKNIRNQYNLCVENYNQSLIRHRMVCLKLMGMKPLDTYGKNKA